VEQANIYVVIITGLTLVGTVVTAWISWKVQGRNREWQVEDQKRNDILLAQHLELKQKLNENAVKLNENTILTQQVKEDTSKAFDKANDVSTKLADSQKLTVEAVKAVTQAVGIRNPGLRTREGDK